MEEADASAKRSKPLCTEKQVSSSQQLSGRAEESLNRFMSLLTLRLFAVRPWLLCPARYLFLDAFFVETVCAICASVFLSVCEKHKQRGKSMCPQAIKTKSIPFIQSIFRVEWCWDSHFCLDAICEIYLSFIISSILASWIMTYKLIYFHLTQAYICVVLGVFMCSRWWWS